MDLPGASKLTYRDIEFSVLKVLTFQPQSTATIFKLVKAMYPKHTVSRDRVLSALSRLHGSHLVRNVPPMFWQKQ